MYLYPQESIMDANTDPHVIRANQKYLYNIWTLDMGVAIKNLDLFTWIVNFHRNNVYKIAQKSHDLLISFQTIK